MTSCDCLDSYTAEDLDRIFPNGWLAVHRFPVYQKGKPDPRACDNFTFFGHNSTSETVETIDAEGPDTSVAIGECWVSSASGAVGASFSISSLDGEVRQGKLHEFLANEVVKKLTARLIDLKRTYKQLASSPRNAELCTFALQDKDGIGRFS